MVKGASSNAARVMFLSTAIMEDSWSAFLEGNVVSFWTRFENDWRSGSTVCLWILWTNHEENVEQRRA